MSIDNSTGKTKGFYERGQAMFDRIPTGIDNSTGRSKGGYERSQAAFDRIKPLGETDIDDALRRFKSYAEPREEKMAAMPTKICGPNLVGILNSAGFYQKKEWVGLTDEETRNLLDDEINKKHSSWMNVTATIEAKLKEKNT